MILVERARFLFSRSGMGLMKSSGVTFGRWRPEGGQNVVGVLRLDQAI